MSYTDKRQRLAREEVAQIEIGHTTITGGQKWVLIFAFLATIFSISIVQTTVELRRSADGPTAPPLHWIGFFQRATAVGRHAWEQESGGAVSKTLAANAQVLAEINRFEDSLSDDSIVNQALLGPTQLVMARLGGVGNEQAYLGRDGWLFYRPGIDYVVGPPFLDDAQLRRRAVTPNEYTAAASPDPRVAIRQFSEQLARRDIALIVMPCPIKPVVHPEMFTGQFDAEAVHNLSYQAFFDELSQEDVLVYDPTDLLVTRKQETGQPQFLETDTHWTPDAMQAVAADLAAFIRDRDLLDPVPATAYRRVETPQENLGDIAAMLKLPESQTLFRSQRVVTQQVLDGINMFWRPKRDAEVLLLGDSFANIYSMSQLGWGESAGLAEQLSFELGRPIDAIRRNADGAHATRTILSRELARGRDRLAGKRLVIWEFAVRELAVGDWKSIPMRLGESRPGSFLELPPGKQLELTATIEDIAAPPKPGSVPYKDHIIPVHLANLHDASSPLAGKTNAMVFMWSMRDNVLQPAARYRIGDEVRLRLWAWETVAATMGRINQGELDDAELSLKPFHYAVGPDDPAPELGVAGFQPAETEAGDKPAPHDDPEQGDTNESETAIASADGAPDDTTGEESDSLATVEDIRKQAAVLFEESVGETIVGRDGWLFLPSELRYISVGPFSGEAAVEASSVENPDYRDPLPAIVDFHKQLADRGIDLLLMPVPAKANVYPDKLFADVPTPPDGKPPRYDDARRAFAAELKEQGVRVVDLWPLLTDMRAKSEQAYCRTDTHFSPLATVRIAQKVASEIKQKAWYTKQAEYKLEERSQSIRGDLSVGGTQAEELPFRFVYDPSGVGGLPVEPDSESPILLLGDSHTLVFHIGEELHATGAGLADQLAAEFGIPIDVIGVRGSGATPARINLYREGRSNPGYIDKKKLVIWCFTAREFTEGSGWRKLPVAPK